MYNTVRFVPVLVSKDFRHRVFDLRNSCHLHNLLKPHNEEELLKTSDN